MRSGKKTVRPIRGVGGKLLEAPPLGKKRNFEVKGITETTALPVEEGKKGKQRAPFFKKAGH